MAHRFIYESFLELVDPDLVDEPMDESDSDMDDEVDPEPQTGPIENGIADDMSEEDLEEDPEEDLEEDSEEDPEEDSEEDPEEDSEEEPEMWADGGSSSASDDSEQPISTDSALSPIEELPTEVPAPILPSVTSAEVPATVSAPAVATTTLASALREDPYVAALRAAGPQIGLPPTHMPSTLTYPSYDPVPSVPRRFTIGSGSAPRSGYVMEEVLSLRRDNDYLRGTLERQEHYVRSLERDVMYYHRRAWQRAQPLQAPAPRRRLHRSSSI